MKRAALLLLTAALFAACSDHREPTAARSSGLSADISDAGHTSTSFASNPHFWWLPPLVAAPSPTGVFNPRLSPVVQVCNARVVMPCPADQLHVAFTKTSGPGSQTVRVDAANEQYIVNWNTDPSTELVGSSFRLLVVVHDRLLGFADVDVLALGNMRNANTGVDIPLADGRTLPIKFRLEEGALAASCTNVSLDCVEQTAFPDKDNTILTKGKQAGTFLPAGALSQIVTVAIIENTTKPCIPPPFALPQYFPEPDQKGCYDFFTDPGPSIFNTTPDNPVIVAICVESGLDPATTGRNIQLFQFDPGQPARPLTPHSAAFMPCEPDPYQEVIGSARQGLSKSFAFARARLHRVLTYFAPTSLHAAHVGVGGSTGSYSTMTWSILAQMDKNSADPQTAAVGTPVPAPPQVLLRDTSTVHNPVAGVTVTFSTDGGTIANPTVVTGSDGLASVGSWTLPATPGTYHVTATAGGSIGSPQVFTATAVLPIFQATFTSDAAGAPPGTPEIGAWTLINPDGTILVQSAVGNLTSKPVELTQLGLQAGSVKLFGAVAGTPPASGVYVARWRSLVHSADACFNALVLRDAGSLILADVDYRPGGQLTYNSNSLNLTVGSWTRDVAQLFEITVDLDNHVTSLSIDGVPVTAAQGLPFSDPTGTPANLGQINMELGCIAPQDYAWDDITIARQ